MSSTCDYSLPTLVSIERRPHKVAYICGMSSLSVYRDSYKLIWVKLTAVYGSLRPRLKSRAKLVSPNLVAFYEAF